MPLINSLSCFLLKNKHFDIDSGNLMFSLNESTSVVLSIETFVVLDMFGHPIDDQFSCVVCPIVQIQYILYKTENTQKPKKKPTRIINERKTLYYVYNCNFP